MHKILSAHKFSAAALSVGAIMVTGGATYAAINWFNTDVATRHSANTVYSVAKECPPSLVQHGAQTNTSQYKILKPELISERDLQLDELSTCEERAITSSLQAVMPGIYEPGDSHDGFYYPIGTYGTVVSATATTVTIANVPLNHEKAPREIANITLHINGRTLVTDKGQKAKVSAFSKGDPIYFIFQNKVNATNGPDWRATPTAQSTVRAIAKTQYDGVAIKEKVFKASQKNAFQILKKSDAYGG